MKNGGPRQLPFSNKGEHGSALIFAGIGNSMKLEKTLVSGIIFSSIVLFVILVFFFTLQLVCSEIWLYLLFSLLHPKYQWAFSKYIWPCKLLKGAYVILRTTMSKFQMLGEEMEFPQSPCLLFLPWQEAVHVGLRW